MAKQPYRGSGSSRRQEKVTERKAYNIRRQTDDEYDDDDYMYDDELSAKRANMGCLIVLAVVMVIVIGAGLIGFFYVKTEIDGNKATATGPVVIEVLSGDGARNVGAKLLELGMITNESIFRFYVRFQGANSDFQVGRFELQPGMSYDEILEALSQSPMPRPTVTVTFPEGSTVRQFARIAEDAGLCSYEDFIEEANNGDFSDLNFMKVLQQEMEANPAIRENTFMRAEGYLLPNTYEFYTDEDAHYVVRKLFEAFDKAMTPERYTMMAEKGLSLRQVVALASVVEEEASDPANQPGVAGVFMNRVNGDLTGTDLNRRTLGSDATLLYIRDWISRDYGYTAEDFEGLTLEQTKEKLLERVPENIFYAYYTGDADPKTNEGIINGPISAPSLTAIDAVLQPAVSDNFYFLSDLYGNYYYAHDWAGHQRNIAIMYEENAKFEEEQERAAASQG